MKRKKVLMTTVAVGTALLGTNVQADEVEQQLPPVSEASLAAANEAASTNPVAQASAEVEKLQLELNHQQDLVATEEGQMTAQTNLVAKTQEELKQEDQAVADAKEAEKVANADLKQVTTEQILALEKEHPEIALVLNEASEASAAKAKVEQELAAQEETIASANQNEASAVEKQELSQAELGQAQKQVGQATENFNKLGQKQASLLQDLKEAEEVANQAEAAVTTAQEADQKRNLAIEAAEKDLNQAIQARNDASNLNLEQAKQELSKAQEAGRLASQQRNAATQGIRDLEARLVNAPAQTQTPRVEIIDGYDLNLSTAELLAVINRNGGKNSRYSFDEKKHTTVQDRNTMLNISNLSEQVRKELNEYGIRILNQMKADYRNKTGQATSRVVLSDESINQAKIVADTYEADRFNNFKEPGHNQNAFTNALAYHNAMNVTEDINAKGPYKSPNITKAVAKKMIYDALYNMVYKDEHVSYSHAKSILGIKHPNEKYLGLDFSYVGAVDNFPGAISVHITKTNGFRSITPNTDGYVNTDAEYRASGTVDRSRVQVQIDAQRQNLTRATADLTLAQSNQNKAQNRITSLSQALKTDDTTIVAKREALSKARAVQLLTPVAERRHQESLTVLDGLKKAYTQLEAEFLSKKVVLEDATQVLADKETALATARNNLVLAKGRVEVETTKLNFLKRKLDEADEHINKLETAKRNLLKEKYEVVKEFEVYQAAKVNLLKAKDRVTAAEERVNSLKANLLDAQAKLDAYKESHRQALAKRDQIKADLTDKTKSLAELEKLAENHHISSQNGVLIALPKTDVLAELSEEKLTPLVKNETQTNAPRSLAKPLAQSGQNNQGQVPANNAGQKVPLANPVSSAKTLPNTGESTNGLVMLAGATLLTGLVAGKAKRDEN